jgi:hypothetical protein
VLVCLNFPQGYEYRKYISLLLLNPTCLLKYVLDCEQNLSIFIFRFGLSSDRLCGLVVKVPGYRLIGPGSIPGATKFSEK